MDTQFEMLSAWLITLLEPEFNKLINVLVEPRIRSNLSSASTRDEFLGAMKTLSRLDQVEDYLTQNYSDRRPKDNLSKPAPASEPLGDLSVQPIPFTNRQDDLDYFLARQCPPYVLLDAPPGYGKTELLRRLKQFFSDKWECVHVIVKEHDSLDEVVYAIADELNLRDQLQEEPLLPLNLRLASAIKGRWSEISTQTRDENGEGKNGLVFLIDFDGRPVLQLIKDFIEKLIADVQETLHSLDSFDRLHHQFRVIIAGRYLAAQREIKQINAPPLKIHSLSPFDYDVICNSAGDYLPQEKKLAMQQLAAHLLYWTGGHPECVAKTLRLYAAKNLGVDKFTRHFSDAVWDDIVQPAAASVHGGIPGQKGSKNIIDRLSVFRYFDTAILRYMIQNDEDFKDFDNEHNLADALTATYLLSRKGRFIQDDVTRRLLVIHLRHERPDKFPGLCQQAQALCAERLQQLMGKEPQTWVIEYLFQALQNHALTIQDKKARQTLQKDFFQKVVPQALDLFISNIPEDDRQAEQELLGQKMDDDWEFQFTLNYYLRDDEYTEAPYQVLLKQVFEYLA
ncbi:MAG: hypothetical protein JW963_14795 [Anaerolineales bacterium]|nr:hypothetical protein [Anaerolineales bacterium]